MSGVSLEGTGDTPYNFLTPYITPYIDCLPNPIKKPNPLQILALYFNLWQSSKILIQIHKGPWNKTFACVYVSGHSFRKIV